MVRIIFIAIMLLMLTACSNVLAPTQKMVEKAIALQLELTQQYLSKQLDLNAEGFEVKRISISKEKPVSFQGLPTFHVQGTYDLNFKLPNRDLTEAKKPFDFYMQLQKEGKTWRLFLPDTAQAEGETTWRSYFIPPF